MHEHAAHLHTAQLFKNLAWLGEHDLEEVLKKMQISDEAIATLQADTTGLTAGLSDLSTEIGNVASQQTTLSQTITSDITAIDAGYAALQKQIDDAGQTFDASQLIAALESAKGTTAGLKTSAQSLEATAAGLKQTVDQAATALQSGSGSTAGSGAATT